MKLHFQKYKTTYILSASLIGLCSGVGTIVPIWQSVPIVFGCWGLIHTITNKVLAYTSNAESKYETVVQEFENTLSNQEEIIQEQEEVIQEYEQIFDSLSVKLPCICGGNTFEGLFSPNTANEVVCEKCRSKYRVDITYDTVLISEPTDNDQPFEILVGKPQL